VGSTLSFTNLGSIEAIGNESSSGGFLYIENAKFNLGATSITISNNVARDGSGGGLYLSNSTMSFDNIHLDGNIAASSGGGVYLVNGSSLTFRDIDLLEFSNNTAGRAGGVFYVDSPSYLGFVNIKGLVAEGNVGASGGFAYFINKKYTIDNNLTFSMIANTASNGSGGGLYLKGSTFIFNGERPVFKNNVAQSSGGAVYLGDGSLLELRNFELIQFTGQSALTGGGGVFYVDATSSISFINIGNIYAINNEAANGGFLYVTRRNFDFSLKDFEIKVDLISNTAILGSGGALYLSSSAMRFSKERLRLDYNFAYSSGGAVYAIYGSNISISSYAALTFAHNTTLTGGGGVFYIGNKSTLTFYSVDDLNFSFNTAGSGGALYAYLSNIIYRSAIFDS
jgi:hypothetical protein